MTSSKNTAWIAGTGVLAVLILVASYFLLIAPKRAEAADTVAQAAGVEQGNETLAAETERLKAQFATLDDQRAQLAEIQAELPAESEVPALIRQFSVYAAGAGVSVKTIAPGTLTAYAGDGTTATTTTGTTASGTNGGISVMPISVTVEGSFAGTELFVKNLQADMHRYILVDGVALVDEDTTLATTITGSIFVLADDATVTSTASTGTDATTPATSAAATSTGTVN
ncbi:type 4a pilus biogenesis protein PilO [Kineococcus sp. NBC_00420]|uniref:type 4a pilus biogenesis protein PilO n=1 Tax=Kineococcus sp. NBC_00420 TaxID=2903564 RepID=UPI002E2340A4